MSRHHIRFVNKKWWPALWQGRKTHELRSTAACDFQAGDAITLRVDDLDDGEHLPDLTFTIKHVLVGDGTYGLAPGYAILSLSEPRIGCQP